MENIEKVINHPVGILAIVLILGCIVLFIWNMKRKELSHEEWSIIKVSRIPELEKLSQLLEQFKDYTNKITETESINTLELYGLSGKSPMTEIYPLLITNKPYELLRDNDVYLTDLKSNIEMIVSKLGNKKLRKIIHSLYRREEIAHKYYIFTKLYTTFYELHPEIEKRIHERKEEPLFEQAFKYTYEYIGLMKRGADL